MKIPSPALALFTFFASTLYLLETVLTIDFNGNFLAIALQLDLFAVLIGWHIGVGLLAPRLRSIIWPDADTDRYDIADNEQSEGFLPMWARLGLPVLVAAEVLLLMQLLGDPTVMDVLIIVLYIIGPSILLLCRHWLIMFFTVLWTWFPIEYGVITSSLGELQMSLIPLDSLLGIFSLLWPLLVHGRHISWYTWEVSTADLQVVGKVSAILTIAIVPLGILTNFITINPDNIIHPDIVLTDNAVLSSILYSILVFYLIFVVQGLMEETLFRDIIFKHQYYWLKDRYDTTRLGPLDLGHLVITLGGTLIISIPFWDDILQTIANILPIIQPVADTVGNMALPLGEYEGKSIPAIAEQPLWIFYLLVAVLLVSISLIIYHRDRTPLMAALLVASMIFGFAHFQDFRYVFFASIAGFGYGYTYYKTKNLVASAMVHMGVDAIWVLILTY